MIICSDIYQGIFTQWDIVGNHDPLFCYLRRILSQEKTTEPLRQNH